MGKKDQMVALVNIYNNCSIFSSFSTGKSKTTQTQTSLTHPRPILPHTTSNFPPSLQFSRTLQDQVRAQPQAEPDPGNDVA